MRMHARVLTLGLLLAAAGIAHGAQDTRAAAYRWVDEHGVVHYGDRIPPEYANREAAILNKQGVEILRREGAKTPEELAEEERRRQEALRQQQHDHFLLTTYTSVKDIEILRDQRVEQLAGQRRAAQQYIENLTARLAALQERAMKFKPYNPQRNARRMPDDLAEDIVLTLNELRMQRNALAAKEEEESAVRAQFEADIARYKELHAQARR